MCLICESKEKLYEVKEMLDCSNCPLLTEIPYIGFPNAHFER